MSGEQSALKIFAAPVPRLFTIDPDRAFLTDLAVGLRASIDALPDVELADALIYLPTRRAVRALGEAFVQTAPDAASLLPRIRALGDLDENEFIAFDGSAEDEIDLPPAISAMQRRITLASMVAAKDRAFDGQERWAGALAAADELGKLLDSFYTEEKSPDQLQAIVPEKFAEHWNESLKFLSIITQAWPKHLSENGLMDPAARKVQLIDRQCAVWKKTPPSHPIIIAGTTGSTPAVARMMRAVAAMPMGCVVLPGLDLAVEEKFWAAIDAPHPQSGLKQLLHEIDVDRHDVQRWPVGKENSDVSRREVFSVALRPAGASDSWRDWVVSIEKDKSKLEKALASVELVEASDEEREAGAIAVAIRGALKTPDKKIMLVTPDRDLARRVSLKLRRWHIVVDDSAGVPFANSPCGTFLRLIASWLTNPSDCVALMAVLRHPLFGGGVSTDARRKSVNAMDRALRGLPPQPGIEGLRSKVASARRGDDKAAEPVLAAVSDALGNWPAENASFTSRFDAHLAIAECLAATVDEGGDKRLWRGDDGETGAESLSQTSGAFTAIEHDRAQDYPDIFDQLIAKITVRQKTPAHPRIAILGPLEARLQRADLVILGGLNEGVWPRDAAVDPFLSRPMRAEIGLPSPEQRIGLAAHDFAQAAAAPSVMITRSTRAGGKPTKPSRWIVRLKNILNGAGALSYIDASHRYDALTQYLDEIEDHPVRISPPSPCPPLDARPQEFFVTRIEQLLRDPYAIYARDILRLEKLDSHNEAFAPRHIGNLFHKIFEDFAKQYDPGGEGETRLWSLYDEYAPQYGLTEAHEPFWRPHVAAAFSWFLKWDAQRRQAGAPEIIEGKGKCTFPVDGFEFTLGAKADRIDRLNEGGAFIVDYKTGAPPTLDETKTFKPQLPLTGIIVQRDGFEEFGAGPVGGFEYVRVINRKGTNKDDVGAVGSDAAEIIAGAEKGLTDLLTHFLKPATTYPSQPRPQTMDEYGDYNHLTRQRERNAQGGGE